MSNPLGWAPNGRCTSPLAGRSSKDTSRHVPTRLGPAGLLCARAAGTVRHKATIAIVRDVSRMGSGLQTEILSQEPGTGFTFHCKVLYNTSNGGPRHDDPGAREAAQRLRARGDVTRR